MTVTSDVGHWALVPSWVRKALRGHDRAMSLYVLLADVADHPNREQGETSGIAQGKKRKWLATELDCSPASVDRSLDVLVEVGAVTVIHRKAADGDNLPNDYHVHQLPPAVLATLAAARVAAPAADDPPSGGMRVGEQRGHLGSVEGSPPEALGPRAGAEVIRNQPPSNQPPSNQPESAGAPSSPPTADDALPSGVADEGGSITASRPAKPRKRRKALVVSEDATRLAALIRDLSQEHADRTSQGFKVRVTNASLEDAHMLLTRGPLSPDDNDRVIVPEPIPYERAERLLRYVFAHPERESSGFSWADQIRSPGNLRKNWYKAASWANAQREAAKTGGRNGRRNEPQPAPDDIDGLAAMPLVDLLRRGLPAMDVVRVGAALRERAAALSAPEREMLRRALEDERNFPRDGFTPTQVDVILADLKPRNAERSQAAAADLAAWGAIPVPTEPLALPGGTP